ncbi:uncharacterized protein LOC113233583 isoform X6 [Hyposmocoma kahamanoa]|uniref:uncharacterized protein LOC113233583 isoform X6 n=1 Tax=Hyposmocoma kahamanoa TaxID=1477025 RepID=UPI000E6D8F0C|nr:uncharacterized protein LOC113233583 isoform X6 [Hyposmocoma kahamanoa]
MKFIIVLGVILAVVTARPSPSSRRRLSRLSLQLVETDDDDEIVNNEKYDHRHNAHHLTPSTATQVPVHMPITVAAPANSQVQLAQPVQGSASIASLLQRLSNLATGPSKASPTPPPSNPTKYRNRGAVKVQYVPSSSSNPDARYLGSLHFRYIAPNELQQSQQVNHENKGDAKNLLLSSFNPRYFTALRNYLRSAAELQDLAQKAAQRSGPSWRNSQ